MNERTQMSQAELLALPSAVDLTTAGRAFGIGRTKAFELARAGEFPVRVIRVGRQFRVGKAVILEALGVTPAAPTGESGPASRRPTFPAQLAQDVPVAEGQQLPAGPLDQPNLMARPRRLPRSTWLTWPLCAGVRRQRRSGREDWRSAMSDTEENGEPTEHWLEVELPPRAFRRVRRQARRAGLPVEEFAKHAILAYARGGWDFTTNVLDRARWARSHGGHPDPTRPLGEQLAVALVLDDDEFLQATGCTRQQAISRLDRDITDDAEAWIADVRAIL